MVLLVVEAGAVVVAALDVVPEGVVVTGNIKAHIISLSVCNNET